MVHIKSQYPSYNIDVLIICVYVGENKWPHNMTYPCIGKQTKKAPW